MAKTLLEVLSDNGIKLIEHGDKWVAHCPFHKGDREPSFTVYPNNTYYCFGCNAWGNPIKFLVEYKGLSVIDAKKIVGEEWELPKAEKRAIKVKNLLKTSRFLFEVAQIYHDYLIEQPGPLRYLIDRGLNEETVRKYMLGYTDGAVLEVNFANEAEMANEVGLLNKNGYETLSHRIVIPNIIDKSYCDFMIGRTVINDKVKYLGLRMPKPMMGFYDVRNSPILFLVEGNFDFLVLRQWGYPAIVMSGSHITKFNYNLLKDRLVVVVPDNDEVGQKAAKEIQKNIPNNIVIDYKSLNVKDIGELASNPSGKSNFDGIVEEALWDINLSLGNLTKWLPNSLNLTHARWT
jgi:DNA primase